MIDCMIDCLIECMIDILTDFCTLFDINAMLLIFLFTVLNLAWPVCSYQEYKPHTVLHSWDFTYRQGIGKGLIDLFRCVRRSRNIQHISERCFPIVFDKALF